MTNLVHQQSCSELFALPGSVHNEIFDGSALGPFLDVGLCKKQGNDASIETDDLRKVFARTTLDVVKESIATKKGARKRSKFTYPTRGLDL